VTGEGDLCEAMNADITLSRASRRTLSPRGRGEQKTVSQNPIPLLASTLNR
jgi:hypothetical protein